MPKAVLEGLKKYPVQLTAISAMLDSGGSAGKERELFKTKVSFGDFRRAALALSGAKEADKERFAYRFENGQVMANTYCTTAALVGGINGLMEDLREDLKIPQNYQFLPATLDNAALCAQLDNGAVIKGENNIDVPKHDTNLKIKKVFLEPEARAYPQALKAIQEADLIVIGPGDLYSSLAQILLVKGISEAIRKSRAKKVYICNLMTKRGETDNFSVLDFTFEIERYLGGQADYVIYNNRKSSSRGREMVKFYDILDREKFIGDDLLLNKGEILHDSDKLAKLILSLCP